MNRTLLCIASLAAAATLAGCADTSKTAAAMAVADSGPCGSLPMTNVGVTVNSTSTGVSLVIDTDPLAIDAVTGTGLSWTLSSGSFSIVGGGAHFKANAEPPFPSSTTPSTSGASVYTRCFQPNSIAAGKTWGYNLRFSLNGTTYVCDPTIINTGTTKPASVAAAASAAVSCSAQ